ncbi:SDR family NAD(P)-dependent oxidoreductase [Acanthopleuribacter pedis]|uniref:SDR family oxidoreductase n=1 Tax=Acanthopleuribacter pedis TaxID=442870 RepID=A0A8J7QDE9_9BACT|nr:SDR family oxidoreductase [Acanthopleuribacter pedis]MBO1317555.1 SDR family oxidoreductase [Acanthopleuribacter pedis]
MIDLSQQVALITGGTRGIGRATCEMLAQAGADIAFSYFQDHAAAEETAAAVKNHGRKVYFQAADMRNQEHCNDFFEKSIQSLGDIDIVVGNAGIWRRAPIDEMTVTEWREVLEVNLHSMFFLSQLATRHFKHRKAGKMVLVSSTAGVRGEPYHAHYAASKGAIVSLTRSLAGELSYYNINVNCVAPGWVETDMTRDVFADKTRRQIIEQSIPLRRIAAPRDIAGVILFLVSPLSRHIQGEIIHVNGGSLIR